MSEIQPSDPTRITADQVLSGAKIRGARVRRSVRLGTYTQRAGVTLAVGVGSVAALITLSIVVKFLWSLPVPPHFDAQMSEDQLNRLLSAQKQSSDILVTTMVNFFESIIFKVFMPVFTLILGYIFGTQRSSDHDGRNDD